MSSTRKLFKGKARLGLRRVQRSTRKLFKSGINAGITSEAIKKNINNFNLPNLF